MSLLNSVMTLTDEEAIIIALKSFRDAIIPKKDDVPRVAMEMRYRLANRAYEDIKNKILKGKSIKEEEIVFFKNDLDTATKAYFDFNR